MDTYTQEITTWRDAAERGLRAEDGCPWDRVQDLRSLRPYLSEEAFEVLDEMDRVAEGGPWSALCEELGDLLFQIVFHARLAEELGAFTLADVCASISDKLTHRHPHVFGEKREDGTPQPLANWAKLKAAEPSVAHRAIATFHSFRFFGLVFLVPGVVGPALPQAFAAPAASKE